MYVCDVVLQCHMHTIHIVVQYSFVTVLETVVDTTGCIYICEGVICMLYARECVWMRVPEYVLCESVAASNRSIVCSLSISRALGTRTHYVVRRPLLGSYSLSNFQ